MKRHITFVALALVFELLLLPVLTGSAAAAPSHFDGPVNTVTVDDASGLNGAISATGSTATHIILGTDFQPGGIVLLAATVTIPANAVIKISGGTLTGDGSGGVVTVQSDAYLELENVTITGGSTLSPSSAGGVTVSGGELVMKSGARISGNTGFWGGGVQVVNSGVFTMNGGSEVSANTATDSGGGVRVSSGGIFTLENGGKISDNLTGNSGGGGVYVGGGYLDPLLAVFTMNGGEISANRTKATDGGGSGGGVQVVNGGAFTLEGGKISENTAYHLGGGGVYVGGGSANLPADFTMNGGEISLNRAATAGGGSEGGGVKVNWGAVFNMNGGKILNNQAEDGNGGGLYSVELYSACQPVNYTWSGALNIGSGAVFSGNTAKALYKMTNDHETLYTSVVASGAAFSFPLESAYTDGERLTGFNNFDIGYILGEIIYYPPVYTISFAPNGGTGSMDSVFVGTSPQGTSPPYTYSLPENRFSRAGYQFTGWLSSADGQEYGDGHVYTGIDRDIILTAQWRYMDSGGAEPPETVTRTYTVSFASGGGAGTMASATVREGGEYILPPNAFTRTGYTFSGWLANDTESTEYADEAIVGYIVQDIQLTAQWRLETAEHTVSFDGGGGAGAMESVNVADGDDYTLPPNAFTRTGYTFLGWLANDADNTRYADEATIENIVQDIELTARWRANVGDDSSEPPANPSAPNEIVLPLAGGDDAYTEFDDEGNPLGEWHWDESIQEWVFEPYQPLDDLPKTGGSGILLGSLLAAFSAGALALRFAAGKKRGLHPKQ